MEGKLKLNVDGSWKQGEQTGSIAGILRDHTGQVIDGFTQQVRASSPLQVETLAILHGLKLLQLRVKEHEEETELGKVLLTEAECETDCLTAQ
ncbi:hypothetical protein ACJRO7_026644 [Eucalyptus globulus]|uniref:RNase H type-1 domain-containing protein n=1 Tax=Eucalyptus globulus TaxID=34317 RepID=A0ABD3JTF9_EUCGL